MNERIKELSVQAEEWVSNEFHRLFLENINPDRKVLFDEKFAELIVRQCAVIATEGNSDKIALDILVHFGVEEPKGWVCPKCGVDRTKQVCPSGYNSLLTGHCPMIGVAQ
jgi:hypothetical protein